MFRRRPHMSALEGSIGAFQRRLLVEREIEAKARRILVEGRARRLLASRLGVSAEYFETLRKGFLGGRLMLRQLRLGHRVGTDAALVIAAARPDAKGRVADIGAGSGAIGLSLAVLNPALEVTSSSSMRILRARRGERRTEQLRPAGAVARGGCGGNRQLAACAR